MELERLLAMGNHSNRKEFFAKVFKFIFNIFNSFTTSSWSIHPLYTYKFNIMFMVYNRGFPLFSPWQCERNCLESWVTKASFFSSCNTSYSNSLIVQVCNDIFISFCTCFLVFHLCWNKCFIECILYLNICVLGFFVLKHYYVYMYIIMLSTSRENFKLIGDHINYASNMHISVEWGGWFLHI